MKQISICTRYLHTT